MANVGNVYLGVNGQAVDLYSAKKMYVGFNNKAVEIPLGQSKFDYKTWLASASLSATGYANLDAVLADELAVRKLMTIHASVDYLASWKTTDEDIIKILSNDICAKWITLRDYALDTLDREYRSLMESLGKYYYGEWALMPQVPKMTSNTAPYGTASASSEYATSRQAYCAFDGTTSSTWIPNGVTNEWVQYDFGHPVRVGMIGLLPDADNATYNRVKDFIVQGSNDNSTFVDIKTGTAQETSSAILQTFNIENNNEYRYYRFHVSNSYSASRIGIINLQFYAWAPKGNVPIMTSNTAPYGTAYAGTVYGANYEAWKAFDGDESTAWIGSTSLTAVGQSATDRIRYTFTNPVNIRKLFYRSRINVSTDSITVRGSNDGTNFTPLTTATTLPEMGEVNISSNENYYMIYDVEVKQTSTTSTTIAAPGFHTLQFYGRELKVSVPVMTSNTAPYGVAIASSVRDNDNSKYGAWKAFSPTANSSEHADTGINSAGWFGYKFTNPVSIRMVGVYNHSANGYYSITAYQLAYSDDGTNWTSVGEKVIPTQAVVWSYASFSDYGSHLYWRINADAANIKVALLGLQFYGFDYSEYDWDADNPRHYLYDHGVEFTDYDFGVQWVGASGWSYTTPIKNPSDIYIKASSGNSAASIFTDNAMDVTNYNLLFSHCSQLYARDSLSSNNSYVRLNTSTDKEHSNNTSLVSLGFNTSGLPQTVLDISNNSGNEYIALMCARGAGVSIDEWWLE